VILLSQRFQLFTEQAKLRAEELGVADQVKFIHGDAAGYISDFLLLPELLVSFGRLGYDVVEMVLEDQDSPGNPSATSRTRVNTWAGACSR
jgi:hypothetical protein